MHVEGAPTIDPAVYDAGVPVLGICYGAQLVAQQLGGEVARTGKGEYGRTALEVDRRRRALFGDLPTQQDVWMSHFDSIVAAPAGLRGHRPHRRGAGRRARGRRARASTACSSIPRSCTPTRGQEMLKHFLYDVCGCRPTWTMTSIIEQSVEAIRAQVGDEQVICGLSGGVDSAVAAALVHKAVGDQLTCVFVDTGLMRAGEAEQVEETFRRQFNVDLVHVKAADRFLEALDDVIDPERKRKIIGETFIRVFEEVAARLRGRPLPRAGHALSRHHRVGHQGRGQDQVAPQRRRPSRRHAVRAGRAAAQPVQGRGAGGGRGARAARGDRVAPAVPRARAWRCASSARSPPSGSRSCAPADAIVTEEIKRAGLYRELWQSFAVLPAVRTVGVMGDERTYAYPIVIRAVTSDDAMTADWARLPYDVLERLSSRIINEVPGVNRVAFDVTSKPPGTIEWE